MQSMTIPPETLHCIIFIPPIQSLWSPNRHPIRENKMKGGDIYVPQRGHTHIRAREAVYICLDLSIMLCVPVHRRRLRRGRGDASLGQPLRPWHDSSDLSPLLLAQLAQVRLHAGWDSRVQGAPRAASPACGRRQPFGEPFPFQARLVAHGSRRDTSRCRSPRPPEPRQPGSAPKRAGCPAREARGPLRCPVRRGDERGLSAVRRRRPRPAAPPCWTALGRAPRSLPPGGRLSAWAARERRSSASPAPSAPPRAPPPRRARTARAPPRTGDVRHAPSPTLRRVARRRPVTGLKAPGDTAVKGPGRAADASLRRVAGCLGLSFRELSLRVGGVGRGDDCSVASWDL